jgi:hypothetical protein
MGAIGYDEWQCLKATIASFENILFLSNPTYTQIIIVKQIHILPRRCAPSSSLVLQNFKELTNSTSFER